MDFSEALKVIKEGGRVTRTEWGGTGRYVALGPGFVAEPHRIFSDAIRAEVKSRPRYERTATFLPKLLLRNSDGEFEAWANSHADLLASDWCRAEEQEANPS